MRLTFNEQVTTAGISLVKFYHALKLTLTLSLNQVKLHHTGTSTLAATIVPSDMAVEGDGKTLRLIVPWGSLQQSTEYRVTTDGPVAGAVALRCYSKLPV